MQWLICGILYSWKITFVNYLLKLELKRLFLVFLIFKSSFIVFCDCVSSSNMIKKDVFKKKIRNRFNSFENIVYINKKLKRSQNQPLRNLHNEISLKTCFLEFLNSQNSLFHKLKWLFPMEVKGCVRYIFASLFCMSKIEHLQNKEKRFSFHFESSSRSWDNQLLTFSIFKYHDVIKWPSMKHKTHIIE